MPCSEYVIRSQLGTEERSLAAASLPSGGVGAVIRGDDPSAQRRPPITVCDVTAQPTSDHNVILLQLSDLDAVSAVRVSINPDHVTRLAGVLEDCPPIAVAIDGTLVDGAHRVAAAKQLHWQSIPARIVEVRTPALLLVAAAEANSRHSLPMTRAERQGAVERLLQLAPEISNRRLAEACGVARSVVETARAACEGRSGGRTGHLKRLGADGKCYPVAPNVDGRRLASAIIRTRPGMTVRGLADLLAVSIGTAHRLPTEALEQRPWYVHPDQPHAPTRPAQYASNREPTRPVSFAAATEALGLGLMSSP